MASLPIRRDADSLRPPLHEIVDLPDRIRIVDVGANPIGDPPPYASLMATGRADLIGFEPNPEARQALEDAKGPYETYLPYAVADGGRHELKICLNSGMTSLLEPSVPVLSLFNNFAFWATVVERVELDTVRLDDLPEIEGMDYLKIDIQGGEVMVFENARERLRDALVVHTEVCFMQMYIDQPLYGDIDAVMRANGFMLHRFDALTTRDLSPLRIGNHKRDGHSQLFWGDVIYIRDIVDLSGLDDGQILRLANILHDCYRSFDVVLRLLQESDRRTGGTRADAYVAALDAAADTGG
ncbi:FkbM family methyltransferase [Phenylobacterium sp. J367]|uniref:FkbM family methyltransferase n=1 Tax=Phenylobacterium sp. J367 TaxID=2898435 RepID=UPI0021507E49|nr:FkbM family methyltransferase [Phenylobacterium sp. J367]MCR5878838.1 FkbM family methyltransferase [Phenylobacterium sp. J367]